MVNRDEVWAQGSNPGDPPISSTVVPVDPQLAERNAIMARLQPFARGARPAGPDALLHDLLRLMRVHE